MMLELLQFILILLIVVSLHEVGHLIVASLCGVKVKAYSIGFGRPYLKKKNFGIEFRITPWLLGGYVELEGEQTKIKNGFLAQRYIKKVLILIAGCFVNILLSCIVYQYMYNSIQFGFWVDWNLIKILFTKDFVKGAYIIANLKPNFFLMQLTLISTFCAITNLLPLPALDGGTIWLLWLEKIYKKKFATILTKINQMGFLLLLIAQIIIIYWIYKDLFIYAI